MLKYYEFNISMNGHFMKAWTLNLHHFLIY